jgi:hypothetical protein
MTRKPPLDRKSKVLIIGVAVVGVIILNRVLIATSPPAPRPTADDHARELAEKRESENYALAKLGERAISAGLKDPSSGQFRGSFGRIKHGMHVACGHVKAKNSFGALAGESPWVVVVEQNVAMVQSYGNSKAFVPIWNRFCTGVADDDKAPPKELFGVRWGSRPIGNLKPLNSNKQVWVYAKGKPTSYLGVPIVNAWFLADNGRIFGGEAQAKGKDKYELLKAKLITRFGLPTSSDDTTTLYKWDWGKGSGLVFITYNSDHDDTVMHQEQQP